MSQYTEEEEEEEKEQCLSGLCDVKASHLRETTVSASVHHHHHHRRPRGEVRLGSLKFMCELCACVCVYTL